MSILRTHNLQNPDSSSINIVMDQGGNTNITGVTTVGGSNFHVPSGSVGIGTDNPISNLQVFGTNGIRITNSTNQNATTLLNFESNHPAFRMLNTSGNTTVKFKSDGDSFITSGNLGIGTDNPGTKLDVRGGNWSNGDIVVGQIGNAGRINFRRGVDGSDSAFIGFAAADNNSRLSIGVDSGDGTIAFQTNSAERLRITSAGSVGIGSAIPANVLDVQGTTHTKIHVGTTGTGHATGIQINHAKGNAALQEWQLQTDGSADGNLKLRNATSSTDVMFFDADNNNIGIGSEAPRYPLDVYNGNLLVSGSSAGNIILEDRGVGDSSRPFHVVSSDGGKFVINRSDRNASGTTTGSVNSLTLSSSGNLGLGVQTSPASNIHIADLSANGYELKISGNALQFNRSSSSYIDQLHDTGRILFRTGSSYTETMRIESNGKIGINDTSPDANLSVGGSTAFVDIGAAGGNRAKIGYSSNDCYFGTSSSSGQFIFKNNVGSNDNPASSGTERLRITSDGKMGVGTASPNHRLTLHQSGTSTFDALNITSGLTNAVGLQLGINSASNAFFWHTANGGIQFATNNVERMRITNNGITFNGDTAAANALDDYEEGTSTVSIQHITADTNQVYMTYTKIGSVVCIVGVITIVNKTASSGTNGWFHLPFAPSAHNTSKPGCSIQMNTINTSVAYLGFYGNNTNCYFNSLSGGYQNGNSLGNGKIGFTATYTTH